MMSNLAATISKYHEACVRHDMPPHPLIMAVLDTETKENNRMPKLSTHLYLAGNNALLKDVGRLNDLDAEVLMTWLEYNSYVKGLDLRYNALTDDGANQIAILIRANTHLERINLMCNDFEEEGARLLAEALKTNKTLKRLRLNGNKIGNKGGLYFAEALQVNTTLEALDLCDTDLKAESVIALAVVLRSNKTLKALNVGRPLLTSLQEETTDHFARTLKVNKGLEELHMCKQGMMDFGAVRLGEDLMFNHSLVHLDLYCNKISSDGVRQLAEMLKINKTLRILDLSCNRMGDKGAEYLAEALGTSNKTLVRILDLSCNKMGDKGAEYLEEALGTSNKTLVSLDVRQNGINGAGLCFLADSLTSNGTLNRIYIWGNNVAEESGCTAFRNLLMGGRISADNTDVEAYTVDGRACLGQVANGLRSWYYWGPWHGVNALPELTRFKETPKSPSR